MNRVVQDINKINKFKDTLEGVFTLSDLKSFFNLNDNMTFYRRIKTLFHGAYKNRL